MDYLKFDKDQLVNPEDSLFREVLRSNRAGSYASTTIVGCNTRKYHGLLIMPQPHLDGGMHVLLSALDETIIQHDREFNLAFHKFKGNHSSPTGHKYIIDMKVDKNLVLTYKIGGVVLTKEMIFISNSDSIIIKYTLIEAHSETKIRFKPFMAYRNIHALSKCNGDVEYQFDAIPNGIKVRMYNGYPHLHMQFSKPNEYVHSPEWYYDFEYFREKSRGFESLEDLYTPGFFEMPIKKGESIYFYAGIEDENPKQLAKLFNSEVGKRQHRDSFESCLRNAAEQFVVRRGKRTEIVAGFPWFGRVARDTFISLPGLLLTHGDMRTFKAIMDTALTEMQGPLFPNSGTGLKLKYNSVDGSLWFFWALQQYIKYGADANTVWKQYGPAMRTILESFRNGTQYNIHMLDSGLLFAGIHGEAVTWMDAIVDGQPVTPRTGLAVEVNALWYNAICFAMELAQKAGDNAFVESWKAVADMIPANFQSTFWIQDKQYLYDSVHGDFHDKSVRPNQVIAAALPYLAITEDQCNGILERVKSELLTPRGLRTLAPKNPAYKSEYTGDQRHRDLAYHQGSVFPWLFGFFAEAWLKLHGPSGISFVKRYYDLFAEVMTEHGIGTISELYDGDPPHRPSGAISQAWSVSELLRTQDLINEYSKPKVAGAGKKPKASR